MVYVLLTGYYSLHAIHKYGIMLLKNQQQLISHHHVKHVPKVGVVSTIHELHASLGYPVNISWISHCITTVVHAEVK